MTKDFFISYIESDTILHRAIEDINLLPDVEKATYQSFQQKIKITYKDNINEKALLRDIMDVIHNYDDKIKISERIVATEQKLNKLNDFNQSEKVKEIDPVQKDLLLVQAGAMYTYNECLKARISRL